MITGLLALAAAPLAPIAQPQLQPFAHWVGRCFTGDAPGGGNDKHCFEAVYGGQHIRDRHVVTVGGKEVYAGETLYSVEGGKISFIYWNSLGGVGRGTAIPGANAIRFSGTIHAEPDSKEQSFGTVWRMVGDGYEVADEGDSKPRPFRLTE